MRTHTGTNRIWRVAAIAVALLGATAATSTADTPWGEAELFFELNDTAGDLGIHAAIDGDPWKLLEIESPDDKKLLIIRGRTKLRKQGLTQLFFESAEPNFEEFSAEEFFARFPEGEYEISGVSNEGVELESEVELSHVMADRPRNVRVNGQLVPEDCEQTAGPVVSNPVKITWDPVTGSHPEIGETGPVTLELYEFVLETDEVKLNAILPPSVTEFDAPEAYLDLSDQWKLEIIVRTDTHNNTAVESCFEVQ